MGHFSDMDIDQMSSPSRSNDPIVNKMVNWFMDEYERPEESCGRNDQEWTYYNGGPFHPHEELDERFPNDEDQCRVKEAGDLIVWFGGDDWEKQ